MALLAMEVASPIIGRLHKAERTTVKVWNHLVKLGEWMTIIERWDPSRPGHRLLDVLKKEIHNRGMPSGERIREIAELCDSTAAKVRGAIGYYAELKPSDHTVRVCTGESCRARGAEALIKELEDSGERVGELICAGLCACGPAVLRDEIVPQCASQQGSGIQFYISQDSTSLAIGSEDIANTLLQHVTEDAALIRTGSRGLFHLEPTLEVDIEGKRYAFGPISSADIPSILDSITNQQVHPKSLGLVEDLLNNQSRYAMQRFGHANPLDLEGMKELGDYQGLEKSKEVGSKAVIEELKIAGLRGRGGAGFPTHFKWAAAAAEQTDLKFVVANADEGDAGTFIDRMIMEGDPHALIEGMAICAQVIGASQGKVYLRSEYPHAEVILESALQSARNEGILGDHFDIEIAIGAGSYVCGEETALLESLEGRRGEVRARPPFPTTSGLFGKPTIVNNVLTFALAAAIMRVGGEHYGNLGVESSKGTVVVQATGTLERPACFEIPFGGSIGAILDSWCGCEEVVAVQAGGPLGSVFKMQEMYDIELSFEGLANAGGLLGHGGFVCYDASFDAHKEVVGWMRFFRDESCGKCTPCRIGTQRALELIERLGGNMEKEGDRKLLTDLDDLMTSTSLCALGGLAMNPVRSTMERWPSAFEGEIQ